ncbi:MAG: FAD-dependent oxidoreductase, partial [Vicinamibacterales bacterium]
LESFLAEGHEPCYGNRSVWGDSVPRELDSLRDADGHGWHLDRVRFEQWLRDAAVARGAEIIAPATIERVERDGDRWRIGITQGPDIIEMRAAMIIDAAGRAAPIARRLGAQIRIDDRLACGWIYGHDQVDGGRGMTFVEATEDGWWYTAPMPGDRRVLAFHTDADLPTARIARDREALLQHARSASELFSILDAAGFTPEASAGFTAANSAVLEPCAGDGYVAAGDAALSFDPLSSQGLLNALFTGLAAAESVDSHLRGDEEALPRYRETISGIAAAYRRHLAQWYGMEQRWPEAAFWKRRHGVSDSSHPVDKT